MTMRTIRIRSLAAGMLAAALAWPAAASAEFLTGVEVAAGYRNDSLNWDISTDPSGLSAPNVLSELSWKNLNILEMQARVHAENDYGFYAKAELSYGWIVHGRNQDSDYDGNNRTQEFSRSNNSSNGSYVWDGSFGLGYALHPNEDWSIIPLVGAAMDTQKVVMKDGYQTIGDGVRVPLPGPFAGLNSSYKADWWGPWGGLDVQYTAGRLQLGASGEYHWDVAYSGTGDWNLRPKTLSDKAWHGRGYVAGGSIGWALDENWTLRAAGRWRDFTVDRGTENQWLAGAPIGDLSFNHAHWSSTSGSLGLEYRF
ncbi:MAG: autotransporter domain-containing protein [Elusimicrobia bacterium]|nr:autotransporter domain-containing protein [Elusimicrobiota bacterium]